MPSYERKKRMYWIATIVIVLMLIGLLGWYWFIQRARTNNTSSGGADYSLLDATTSSLFGGQPFGSPLTIDPSTKNEAENTPANSTSAVVSITETPVAGFVPYDTSDNAPRVRYVERATGDVYEYSVTSKHAGRILHATIPRTLAATFSNDGSAVVRRYLDDAGVLTSVKSPLGGSAETPGIEHSFLPLGIRDIVATEDGFTWVETRGGSTVISITDADTESGVRTIFESALSEWALDYKNDSLLITQLASNNISGNAFIINTKDGSTLPTMQSVRGLTTVLSPDGTHILFSRATSEGVSIAAYNRETRASTFIPLATIADKCVWSTLHPAIVYCAAPKNFLGAVMPDDWYRGAVSFSDALWRIHADTGAVEPVLDPETTQSRVVDVEMPILNKAETHLFFRNRATQYLEAFALPTLNDTEDSVKDNARATN